MNKQTIILLFMLLFFILICIYLTNNIQEPFIGTLYRPHVRTFRKMFSSNIKHHMKNLNSYYNKFMY